MAKSTQRETEYENAQIIRSMIEHENILQNYRLTWLMTIQGLLFAALGFAWDKKDARELIGILCLLGILVALSSWTALKLSRMALKNLQDWWETNKSKNYDGPPVVGLKAKYNSIIWVLRPWRALPWLFMLGWVTIFIFNLLRP